MNPLHFSRKKFDNKKKKVLYWCEYCKENSRVRWVKGSYINEHCLNAGCKQVNVYRRVEDGKV